MCYVAWSCQHVLDTGTSTAEVDVGERLAISLLRREIVINYV
jgi:hypothetical protein